MRTNVIYCDDNLKRLADRECFPDESVDLIYLDPPFFSNKKCEIIWGDEAEVRSFEDRWAGGIEVYVQWMKERVIELYRILKRTGSIYLHCDSHASHYLKIMMDEAFGRKFFRNEIIWRIGWVSGFKTQKKGWIRNHDTILYYVKTNDFVFNKEYIPYPPGYLRRDGKKPTGKGIPMEDTWNCSNADRMDSIMIMSFSKEKMGYPTQKNENLLERIIKASSNPNDIVLDPFCGCGSALIAAEKLKRQWIGIDIAPTACVVMNQRLNKIGVQNIQLIGMPQTIEDLKNLKPLEFQNWIMREGFIGGIGSHKKSGDMGIDGYTYLQHEPIQVKQSDSIGRNIVDNFETAIERSGKKKGYIIAFSFAKGAYEEIARCKREKKLEIQLITVEELLKRIAERKEPKKDLLPPE